MEDGFDYGADAGLSGDEWGCYPGRYRLVDLGIAQLNMNGLSDAQFSITHNKFINTTAYNNLVSN